MPRAGDAYLMGELPRSHDPLVRVSHSPADISLGLEDLLEMWREFITDIALPLIEDITGINLSWLEPLFGIFEGVASPEDFINLVLNPTGLLASIPAIVEAITGIAGGLPFLGTFFGDILGLIGNPAGLGSGDQEAILASIGTIPIFGPIISMIVEALTGLLGGDLFDLSSWASTLLGGGSPLDALNLFNLGNLLGVLPVSQLGQESPNLLDNSDFREIISVEGGGIWTWDAVEGKTVPGCASVDAASVARLLRSNAIKVAEDDELELGVSAKWSGLTYTGTQPVKLQLILLSYDPVTRTFTELGTVDIASFNTPGATQATWLDLAGTYTVLAGTTHMCLQLCVGANAITGTIKFDDGLVRKVGLAKPSWISGLLGGTTLGDDLLSIPIKIFEGITGGVFGGNILDVLDEIAAALTNIPFTNVNGVGGPTNIGGSIFEFLDNLVGGFVGVLGSGAGFADVFNVGSTVSSNAALGQMGWDILGIRNNKPMSTGMLATSQSSLPFDKVALKASATTFTLTQSTAITLYERVSETAPAGVVRWMGVGPLTDITHFFVNIWKMDPVNGNRELVHASANIIGDVSATIATNKYIVPVEVMREPSEIYGYELSIRGTGTYNVVGEPTWVPEDPDVYPRKLSSVRNSGTSAPPSTISAGATTYASNVPFIEVGVTAGIAVIPHTPETRMLNVAGVFSEPVPSWANFIEVIPIGGGGGGHQGGTWGIGGEGGAAGQWGTGVTWERGVDFDDTDTHVTGVVGAGGAGGGGNGVAGGNSYATINGHTQTGLGGAGGDELSAGSATSAGGSPGNFTYNSIPYSGGYGANISGYPGAAPGGGGAGGDYVAFGAGGPGAPGTVWIRFRQI